MGSAYTPGLTVSGNVAVRRVRRLPIKGEVLVQVGAKVQPDDVVARAMLPGALQTIRLAEKLGVEPAEAKGFLKVGVGEAVEKGQLIAETKGWIFGLGKNTVFSDYTGTIESASDISGHVLVREPPSPVEVTAYLDGSVAEVIPSEGSVIETAGAMVQGIFGVGGERHGDIRVAVESPHQLLEASHMTDRDAGAIIVGGSGVTYEAIERAAEVGAVAIIAGGIRDVDLIRYLGYDIGVAITGQESVPITILLTEGFGELGMAERTFKLLKSVEGKHASVNGATQIRAGVIRPELIVPLESAADTDRTMDGAFELKPGTPIRVIREPYFGRIGTVTGLPSQLTVVESGTEVRVLKANLENGEEVIVPRANVEIIAT